jgi:hypothetical protein
MDFPSGDETMSTQSEALSPQAPGSMSALGSPIALKLPTFSGGHPFHYQADTDGMVVAAVGGSGPNQSWGAISVQYTAADGTDLTATASGANTAALGKVSDLTIGTLNVPVPSGTTFVLSWWGGTYPAPPCQVWFVPFGEGTVTQQPS